MRRNAAEQRRWTRIRTQGNEARRTRRMSRNQSTKQRSRRTPALSCHLHLGQTSASNLLKFDETAVTLLRKEECSNGSTSLSIANPTLTIRVVAMSQPGQEFRTQYERSKDCWTNKRWSKTDKVTKYCCVPRTKMYEIIIIIYHAPWDCIHHKLVPFASYTRPGLHPCGRRIDEISRHPNHSYWHRR